MQLQFDMTRNVFPLFAAYSAKPENYFKEYVYKDDSRNAFITVCCNLLTVKVASHRMNSVQVISNTHDLITSVFVV